MLNKNFSSLLVVFGMTACLWSCGDDDDTSTSTGGKSGTGGAKATGGSGGVIGTGGAKATGGGGGAKATGGAAPTGGAGGKATGGAVGTGGTANQGGGGIGGVGGMGGEPGGMGGMGGEPGGMGGMGGEPGGMAGGDAGGIGGDGGVGGDAGGAGGAPTLTAAQACAILCGDLVTAALPCISASDCQTRCVTLEGETDSPNDYRALLTCSANNLGPTDYACADSTSVIQWSPEPGTSCETVACTWTCADTGNADPVLAERCGCS